MRIRDFYERPTPTISFEFFPPKNADAEEALFRDTVPGLKPLNPSFISVTYGAGGGTRDTTTRVVQRIRVEFQIEAMPHLTCVGSTQAMLDSFLDEIVGLGIENVLALRGDPPKGQDTFQAVEGGFSNATELIQFIRGKSDIGVGAACYPEGHIECDRKRLDWDRTAAKVEAGADFLITQLFYDSSEFLDMWDYLRNTKNVKVPIVPGILPFLSTAQILRFTALCGSKLRQPLKSRLEKYQGDDEAVRQIGVEECTAICQNLLQAGVPGIHFYCLNRVQSSKEIVHNLGLA